MLTSIIRFSLKNKLLVLFFTFTIFGLGIYSITQIPIGAVPDITNNQIQVITTSRNLSTQDIEQFITYPVELEMANLPGVKEIRSISKFGLSVVTIVFEDKMGAYLPRQLISEKIKSASEKIPDGFGSPEMGPITTGLGEIYQYVLEVSPEYKDQYSAMDLRTIQDWIVKRQLSGIPGVVEVNTWGGYLKQYEVTIRPERLQAIQVNAIDIYSAMMANNSVAGGSYIEKGNQSYFIRGEGLIGSVEDIENIIVENRSGTPLLIKDIAQVNFGFANRFGAVTANGEGEKVLGQVMMLKNANSKAVIDAVKERVAKVQPTLPPGISINPFLERSVLIEKTTSTITENLVLGCLIVVFVVVLLLGNIRSGLVVASVIPLSLMFAISLMYLFGIDANLMSLGAIDFGIIIDGAVIIVEFIAFQIVNKRQQISQLPSEEQQSEIDTITFESTNRMTRSAVFGQLIIIIVFIPILSLTGVEGKMFIPMALTFCFALVGTMIFGFTYVPVVSSMFIKPDMNQYSFSTSLISKLEGIYRPVLSFALKSKRLVLSLATILFLSAIYLYSTMGAEFVPTLDEGDFVIQPVLETGTSLSRTIEITTEIEKEVMKFPEVKQVVTRIGAAEVPTDPMSMEETDVIITLNDKSDWEVSKSKDELADEIKDKLIIAIPGTDFEFTQPIEMRFNELITGVRADLAIKVFGEDLDILLEKALEIEGLAAKVPGAADIIVEKIDGLPQMRVKYDRSRIARYGLNIADVNRYLSMAFAGEVAGSVFEGEKRFDLVVRFDSANRQDIENLQNLYVSLPQGGQVPLSALAEVTFTTGPAKISRDDTKRRIVVSINVRNRDLEAVVEDMRDLIENNVDLPPGYSVSYGGQFENLQSARKRLAFAVPVALILIFILLHIAFKSIKEVLMVYTAIPLSAVGGVWLLWLRDMPFSISAGVGFIALFGIAVLNGIVLIEHFKEMKKNGFSDMKTLIIEGATQRLRPVLLTASAAALGFLPMAISTSAGAEVQRPLATVVIGGLITATLLTMVVLPTLYAIFSQSRINWFKPEKVGFILVLLLPLSLVGQSTSEMGLQEILDLAKAKNQGLQSAAHELNSTRAMVKGVTNFKKTNLYYNYDQNNITPSNQLLKVWGVSQSFDFPTVYSNRKKLQSSTVRLKEIEFYANERNLEKEVSLAYYEVNYLMHLVVHYRLLDSLFLQMQTASRRRYEVGESNYLEKLSTESMRLEINKSYEQVQEDLKVAQINLLKWIQAEDSIVLKKIPFDKLEVILPVTDSVPAILFGQESLHYAEQNLKLRQNEMLPDIDLEYFQGRERQLNQQTYLGFQVGLSIPIIFSSDKSKIEASKLMIDQNQSQINNQQWMLKARVDELTALLAKQQKSLDYYESSGLAISKEMYNAAKMSFDNGNIDYLEYIMAMNRSANITIDYLKSKWEYNQVVLEINYLTL